MVFRVIADCYWFCACGFMADTSGTQMHTRVCWMALWSCNCCLLGRSEEAALYLIGLHVGEVAVSLCTYMGETLQSADWIQSIKCFFGLNSSHFLSWKDLAWKCIYNYIRITLKKENVSQVRVLPQDFGLFFSHFKSFKKVCMLRGDFLADSLMLITNPEVQLSISCV